MQDLKLGGKKPEAVDAVPDELVGHMVPLIGHGDREIEERLATSTDAGVTTLLVHPLTGDRRESVKYVEQLRELLP